MGTCMVEGDLAIPDFDCLMLLHAQGYGSELNYKIAAPLLHDLLQYLKVLCLGWDLQ